MVEGIARDLDLSGALVIEDSKGVYRKIYAGDVVA